MHWTVIRIKQTLQLQRSSCYYGLILANLYCFHTLMNTLVETKTDVAHSIFCYRRALTTGITDCLTKSGNDCGCIDPLETARAQDIVICFDLSVSVSLVSASESLVSVLAIFSTSVKDMYCEALILYADFRRGLILQL